MNFRRKLGLDILPEKYAYGEDPHYGHTSEQKIPDRWVPTTCGYCSVGCGMFIGVKGGRAVTVRGNQNHPVNLGKLCPKGLSEHYTLEAPNRARYPLLRKNGKLVPVSWDEALDTMVEKFRATQERYGPDALGVISTGQLVTEEFYALGKLVQLGFGTKNYDGNTTLCMASAVSGYKRSFGSDGPPGSYEDLQKADVIFLIGANIADMRISKADDLARVARIGKDFLITGETGIKNDLTAAAGAGARGAPVKDSSVLERQNGRARLYFRQRFLQVHAYKKRG